MLLWMQNVLTEEELMQLRAGIGSASFESGERTAGILNRGSKNNLELGVDTPERQELAAIVLRALARNLTFEAGARPKKILPPLFSRYTPGMHYGSHLDNAIMGKEERVRVDLSMTLFLSDPDSYDGGELSIDTEYGAKTAKLPAGDAIVYPTTYYHEVKPVTRGERLACITWIQSLVRDVQKRQMLYDLAVLAEWMHAKAPGSAQFRQFSRIQHNLYRMWADD